MRAADADVVAVVLAAGGASRFGAPKQTAPLGGAPLVLHAVAAARHPAVTRIVVVVGAHAPAVRAVLADAGVSIVEARDWAEGLSASLRAGLAAAGDADVLVLLADQPGVTTAAVDRVLARRAADVDAVRATFGGHPGHPVLLRRRILPRLRALAGDRGAADVLASSALLLVPCDDIASGADVDTPADLRRLADGA